MAGSLIKIDEEIVSSAVASVTLTGIDSTYDVYKFVGNNITPSTDDVSLFGRITKGGSADTTSNYDSAYKNFYAPGSFSNSADTNDSSINFGNNGTGTSESHQIILYLFNFANSSEFSFLTREHLRVGADQNLFGQQGGIVHTVASASDGLHFYQASGNIASGTFTLYGLKK
tara:strand:+ start:580 stop:1095 length:516 start_codon:yes stop_codon:yes gene_type:complete